VCKYLCESAGECFDVVPLGTLPKAKLTLTVNDKRKLTVE